VYKRQVLLSTHILSEAQQICDRVLIINNGQIVAEDTPEHLGTRLTGSHRVEIQVRADRSGFETVISQIAGVRLLPGDESGNFELEIDPGVDARPEIARAVVKAGYDLLEMVPVGMSLEEIFLELTSEEAAMETDEFDSDVQVIIDKEGGSSDA